VTERELNEDKFMSGTTMPDTLSREELAAIRVFADAGHVSIEHSRALLAHIDALTAEVEALPVVAPGEAIYGGHAVDVDAVLAILRGEQ
jgi:hypothetical protein